MFGPQLRRHMCIALFGAAALLSAGCSDPEESNNKNNTNNNVNMDMPADLPPGGDDMDMATPGDMCRPQMTDSGVIPCGGMDMADMAPDMEVVDPLDEALSEVGKVFVEAACNQVFDCPERGSELSLLLGRFPTKAACLADERLLKQFLAEGLDESKAAVAAGRQTFDATKAQACIAAFRAQVGVDACRGLDALDDTPAECVGVFTGTVAKGDNCVSSGDCVGFGLRCETLPDQCYGTCEEEPEDLCNGVACEATEYCDGLNDSGNPACVEKVAVGADCDSFDACQGGAICDTDYDADPDPNGEYIGTCKAEGSVAVGGTCFTDEVCARGSRCDADTDKCAAVTLGAAGAACSFPDGGCQPGLACIDLMIGANGATGVCGVAKADGGSCLIFAECAADLQCEGANLETLTKGQCKPLRAVGESCNEGIECESFSCEEDKCVVGAAPACQLP